MIQDFFVAHKRKPAVFVGLEAPIWETCLRSIAFINGQQVRDLKANSDCFAQTQAYSFLLEIICGLHSPIVGETEVFGQFKNFTDEWLKSDPARTPLVQKAFSDAKGLRTQYLSNIGTQSYGSWLKRRVNAKRVHIIGAGQLVQEVLPYLKKQAEVILHVRNPGKVDPTWGQAHSLKDCAFDRGALIVAAPLGAEALLQWLNGRNPEQLFDLRDSCKQDPLRLGSRTESLNLNDVFGEIEQTRTRLQPVIEQVKKEIQQRSEQLAAQAQVRPQGWDDLCA